MPKIFETLVAELAERGIGAPLYIPAPQRQPRGSGDVFEEKIIPSVRGFSALCSAELSAEESEVFNWSLLVPIDFEGAIEILAESSYGDTTTVRSAQRLLPVAKRLAAVLDFPDDLPAFCDSLQLTEYFMDRDECESVESPYRARWEQDLGTAFYVALFLRAAQHSIRLNCPMLYT